MTAFDERKGVRGRERCTPELWIDVWVIFVSLDLECRNEAGDVTPVVAASQILCPAAAPANVGSVSHKPERPLGIL